VVIAGMVTLFVMIAIAVSHTGQTTPLGDGPSRTAARYSNTCGLRQSWAAINTRTKLRRSTTYWDAPVVCIQKASTPWTRRGPSVRSAPDPRS
jgi:hypothetical protein